MGRSVSSGLPGSSKAFCFGENTQTPVAALLRTGWTGGGLVLAGWLICAAALAAAPAAKPKASAFDVVPWSLTPALGSTEARLNLRAERQASDPAPGSETIIVFGKRLPRAPVESELVRHDEPGAESWQSEAAQSYVPGIGDSCSYKSGCFDKDQPGLLSTIPTLFGSH